MNILIIDDEVIIRDTLKDLLELNGHQVLIATCGSDGVRLALTKPDFIFCDVAMPGMDGFAVIEEVRQQEHGRFIPFVFLTAKAERVNQRRGMALGADDYLTKPFTEKEVIDVIVTCTERHQPLHERVKDLVARHRRQAEADWSHELLTPLNGMIGGLQLLEFEADTIRRDELKDTIGLIRAGVERQEKLSRKLIRYFELERIKERGAPLGSSFRCQADATVTSGALQAVAEFGRRQDLTVRAGPGCVPLPEAFLAGAVAELAGNALRFSAAGQRVSIVGEPDGPHYRIEVLDEGPGMTADERSGIAPFTQFGRGRREQQGLGLGLAIVRLLVQVADGNLRLDEGQGGRGLKVTVVLPLI